MPVQWTVSPHALFTDRVAAGADLANALRSLSLGDAVVVGLARGGVVVAAEVARSLELPLDVVCVRKIGHPAQPEYAIGAVAPGDGVFLRGDDGLDPTERRAVVERARSAAAALDARIHERHPGLALAGRTAVLVDDGLATGATMIAAVRWAHAAGAAHVVAAVPVGAAETVERLRREDVEVLCLRSPDPFFAVGVWYDEFEPVEDDEVLRLLDRARATP